MKKLKRSLLCFAMVFCIVFSLCGCKEEEISIGDMPEIVFVVYQFHNENDDEGNFLGEICKGYYIKRTGEIKYFEFDGDEVERYGDADEQIIERELDNKITMADVAQFHNLKALHEKFSQYNMDSGYDDIPEEDIKTYYGKLLKVNTNRKAICSSVCIAEYVGYTCCYGVKKGKNGEQEFIHICENSESNCRFNDRYIKELEGDLKNLLPNNKLRYF